MDGTNLLLDPFIGRESYWAKRWRLQKQTIFGLGAFFIISVLSLFILCSRSKVCQSGACHEVADVFKQNLNEKVDPCDDFYSFACGNFEKHHMLPGDQDHLDIFGILDNQIVDDVAKQLSKPAPPNEIPPLKYIRKFFTSALAAGEKDDFTKLRKLDEEIRESKSLEDLMIATLKNGFEPFMFADTSINSTSKLKSVAIFKSFEDVIHPSELFADKRDTRGIQVQRMYYQLISTSIQLFYKEISAMDADHEARKILQLQQEFARADDSGKIIFKAKDRIKMATAIKGLNLATLMDGLLGRNSYDQVTIYDVEYFKVLANASKERMDVLKKFMTWKLIETYGWTVSKTFTQELFKLEKVRDGIKEEMQKERKIIHRIYEFERNVLGRIYIDAVGFDKTEVTVTKEMIEHLRPSMTRAIYSNYWMDDEAKEHLKNKLEQLKFNVGYSEWIMDDEKLTKSFNITFNESDEVFELFLNLRKTKWNESISGLHQSKMGEDEWFGWVSPIWVHLRPSLENTISVPAGFLSGVLHHPNRPKYVNYGIAGTLIAQEMTWSFLTEELERGSESVSNATRTNFEKITNQLTNLYNKILDERTNLTLSGKRTNTEDVADHGGVQVAYDAYTVQGLKEAKLPGFESWSAEKMFFLSYANAWCEASTDEFARNKILDAYHSPAKYRVNIPLSNFHSFAGAFECKIGSKMNPKDKINVW